MMNTLFKKNDSFSSTSYIKMCVNYYNFLGSKLKKVLSYNFYFYNPKISIFFIFLVSAVLGLGIYGKLIFSHFSLIDDHNIIKLLHNRRSLGLEAYFQYVFDNSDFVFGQTPRFRPSLFPSIAAENFIFGSTPGYYFCLRVALYILVLGVFGSVVITLSKSLTWAIVMVVTLGSFDFWPDILSRIIVSEVYHILYTLILTAIIFVGFSYFKNGKRSKTSLFVWCLFMTINTLLLLGVKENSLVFSPIALFALHSVKGNFLHEKSFLSTMYFMTGIPIFFTAFQAFIIIKFLLNSSDGSLDGFWSMSTDGVALGFIFVTFITSVSLLFFYWKKINFSVMANFRNFFAISFIFIIALASQYIFYSGDLRSSLRYGYPAKFFILMYFVYIVSFVSTQFDIKKQFLFVARVGLLFGFFLVFQPWMFIDNYRSARVQVANHVQHSTSFNELLLESREIISELDLQAVVVVSNTVWDYEIISSIYKYFRYYLYFDEDIFLQLNWSSDNLTNSVEDLLGRRLIEISSLGPDRHIGNWYARPSDWGFSPLIHDTAKDCLGFLIGPSGSSSGCSVEMRIVEW